MTQKKVVIEGADLPIREFSLNSMVPYASICMIAKRGSGKSWVVRAILKHFKSIPGGLIIAPTDRMSAFYGKFFPRLFIHYEYKGEILDKMITRQKKMIRKRIEKAKERKKVDPRAFLVMDDCLSTKGTWMRDRPIMQMFYDGRHYKIMYILTMQFPLGISPELRANFDYIFLLAEDFQSNQKRLFDHYAGMFPDFNSFKQVFREVTADYGAMVIVNRGAKADFLDKVFWYKATNTKIDRIGSIQFNEFNNNNYNPNWEDDLDKKFDIENFVADKKKDKSKINVKKQVE